MLEFLDLIKKQQLDNGSFPDAFGSPSVIHTALVLSGLNAYSNSTELLVPAVAAAIARELENIRIRAVSFLLAQKDGNWNFSADSATNFFALAVLAEYDQDLIDGGALALIMKDLIALESEPGGPYHSSVKSQKVDPITNAGIAKFLSFFGVELPNLKPYQELLATIDKAAKVFSPLETPALSAAKTMAAAVGGLSSEGENLEKRSVIFSPSEAVIRDKIIIAAEKRLAHLSAEFRGFALRNIETVIARNHDKQMSLMAFYTKQALGNKADAVSDDLVAEMGLANIFFWAAFVIYDDFWDKDEAADPRLLPVANLFARSYVDFFNNLLPEVPDFRIFFQTIMDGLDEANNWETIHCRAEIRGSKFIIPERLPDYGSYEFKYRPASGHILGSVAILLKSGFSLGSPEVMKLIEYFKNYLIAMQINDDSHDWEEDLRRGHISTVVAMLLDDLAWPRREIDLETDLPELKKVFWFKTIKKAAQIAATYAGRSKQALGCVAAIENRAPLEKYANLVAAVAGQAISKQQESEDFLRAYQKR
jgi:hypothetical protein